MADDIEKKLNSLFDYQNYAGNARLFSLIKETEDRYNMALDDDDLEMVSAAMGGKGVPDIHGRISEE